MAEKFIDVLGKRVILMDGAMATELYDEGVFINMSYDALSLSKPALVEKVHRSYRKAGAEVLTTNTFGANRFRLMPFGKEAEVAAINAASVRIARKVAGDQAWVAGSIGPTGVQLSPIGMISPGEAYAAYREQAAVLAEEGVDLFLLETFSSLKEAWQAFRACRKVAPNVPVLVCMSFHYDLSGTQLPGPTPEEAAKTISSWGAEAMGVNCANGPKMVLQAVKRMAAATDLPVAAVPNAGLPQMVDGRSIYMAGPEYMAEYARRFVQKGATLIGGCCGTTPAMIQEIKSFIRSVNPAQRPVTVTASENDNSQEQLGEEPIPAAERSEFAKRLLSGKFCISVELDPPREMDPSKSIAGASYLKENGIDVINIADGPRAMARMNPASLAQLVQRDSQMESVVHFCCRDRNLLGMQMDLLGNHALGLHNILAVTGDPPKMGSYPDATAVFDIDSIGLIAFLQMMNRGLDFSGRPMGGRTKFFIGAGCNPAHIHLDLEIERYGKKVEAGAEFFFSQPIYDMKVLTDFLDATSDYSDVPFMVGILPLASSKNAEFLHNEVPGMQVPDSIRERLRNAPTKKDQRRIGIEVAQETLKLAKDHPRINGAYIYPPFGSYKAVLKVIEVL
ncbi:MAG: bifunctional homocysteine S-methyltransferase/methylenetetrahydrofolate reductase [Myxococcota bacterium]|nr:bifunctional homocysteine S-methyltransferase/methylenetetrahydrofolate reductase [Myxococcota bacterium]